MYDAPLGLRSDTAADVHGIFKTESLKLMSCVLLTPPVLAAL
jgi:hypothetical protein